MRILVCNDDGYYAPGIEALAQAMQAFGEVRVFAPARDRSGASNSLTLSRPLVVKTAPNGFCYVDGTPTDCVHVAATGVMEQAPDLVVSGINNGPNVGDDVLYSGTVAAAMEGYMLGLPSFAFSLCARSWSNLDTAADVARRVIKAWLDRPQPRGATLVNVNIPDVPLSELKGMQITRLGKRHPTDPVIPTQTPRGDTVYWIGPAGKARDASVGTDFHAIEQGWASVTPLQLDLTASAATSAELAAWLPA